MEYDSDSDYYIYGAAPYGVEFGAGPPDIVRKYKSKRNNKRAYNRWRRDFLLITLKYALVWMFGLLIVRVLITVFKRLNHT